MILSNGVQQRFCIHKFRSLGSDCLVSMLLARYISFCDACFIVLYTLPTTSYLTVSILASVGIAHLAYYAVLFDSLLSPSTLTTSYLRQFFTMLRVNN